MVTLLTREFTVGTSLQSAWDHLARIEQWPSWARHIRKVELKPAGELIVVEPSKTKTAGEALQQVSCRVGQTFDVS